MSTSTNSRKHILIIEVIAYFAVWEIFSINRPMYWDTFVFGLCYFSTRFFYDFINQVITFYKGIAK